MRKRSALVAGLLSLALPVLGFVAASTPALAAGQGTPPGSVAMVWTANAGQSDLMIHDPGHGDQATLTASITGDGLETVNQETIGGVVYFQIEDAVAGLCANDGNAPAVKWESCPVDNAGELVSLAGTNGNEIKFKSDSDYLTAASLTSGADISLSSAATPSAENQYLYSNPEPGAETLPVDFVAASSGDWTTIADDANNPYAETRSAIFEVCDAKGDCGGNQSENDTDWDAPIASMNAAGLIPLYYISTNYGATSLTDLEASISNARGWYGGTYGHSIGFMFDEVQGVATDTCATNDSGGTESCQDYYQALDAYIDGPTADGDLDLGTIVMLNPGDPPTADYLGGYGGEIIQVFESDRADLATLSIPSWMVDLPSHDFSATVSGEPVNGSDVSADQATLEADGIGNSYLVPDYQSGSNEGQPDYTALPSWYASELTQAASYDPGVGEGEIVVP